jgi:hypothetical protein
MTQATSTRGNAPKDVILGFLESEGPHTVWVPLGVDGKFWFRRDTFVALLNADRITVQSYNGGSGVLHAVLDGRPIVYTNSLFGIVDPRHTELTV